MTTPATFDELRWRLQHIAEEEYGRRLRQAAAAEDSAAAEIARKIG